MNRKGWRTWRTGAEGKRKKGRPRVEGEVTMATTMRRMRVDKFNEYIANGLSVTEAQGETNAWWERWNKEQAQARSKEIAASAGGRNKSILEMGTQGIKTVIHFKPSRRQHKYRKQQTISFQSSLNRIIAGFIHGGGRHLASFRDF